MKNKIKVIHILSDTNIGGAGTLLINYLKNFDKEKFLIKVILPKDSLLAPRITDIGYEVIFCDYIADKSFDAKAVNALKKIFKEEKPDIVHAHSTLSAKVAAKMAGVKSRIYTRHCAYEPPKLLTTFPGKQINGFINNSLSTHIVAVAQAAKDNLTDTGVDDKKISVIINGVEKLNELSSEEKLKIRQRYNLKSDDLVFGIVARLEKVKGHICFINAAKKICDEYDNVKFLIVGIGAEEENLKKLVSANHISDKVIFTGFIKNVAEIFNIIDINVNCSYGTETSSLALSEAMSIGVPAIASIYGGNPYMITDTQNGLLYEKENPQALYIAMKKMIDDPKNRQEMAKKAYEHYEKKFTARNMTKQLENIYENQYYTNSEGAKS